jgi:hypothetical protein
MFMAMSAALAVDKTNLEALLICLSVVDDEASDDGTQSLRGTII